jgi:hypothetical protein
MMQTIYRGRFASREGVVYEIYLKKENNGETFGTPGELSFPAEEPLTLEWSETSKEEVTCGATATLTVISPGDRTYLGLYTVEAGSVRMDVYRAGALYWSGTLDTEFYEEPYATTADYEVTLTFSDFGILDRLKYAGTGVVNCKRLVEEIVAAASFSYEELVELCATGIEADGETGIEQIAVRADNFYDEEGEASTLKEVMEGVLQPLGLRVVQYGGRVYVYDLESAYRQLPRRAVRWMSDDQTLGVDKVVNNVEVELSTYASGEVLTGDMDYPGKVETGTTALDPTDLVQNKWSYYEDLNCTGKVQFTAYTTATWDFKGKPGLAQVGDGNALHSQPRWMHIDPLYGGEETDCVAVCWRTGIAEKGDLGLLHGIAVSPYMETVERDANLGDEVEDDRTHTVTETKWHEGQLIYRSYQSYLGRVSAAEKYVLRVKIEMRLEARYNPFGTGDDNRKEEADRAEEWVNMVRMRGRIQLKDQDGNVLMHVENTKENVCTWVAGADEDESMVFCWRDLSDVTAAAVDGWMTNVHYGVRLWSEGALISKSYVESEAAGTLIPYPPQAGYLEVELYSGVRIDHCTELRSDSGSFGTSDTWEQHGINSDTWWWHLVKAPVVTLLNNDAKMTEPETDDVTYTGELNAAAKEDLTLNTLCGTLETENAAARATYLRAETGAPLTALTRAGRTTTAEQLLIGTLYSQFAERKLKLTGTAAIEGTAFDLKREASAEGVDFLVVGEVQDLGMDLTEVTMVELRPDEYESE